MSEASRGVLDLAGAAAYAAELRQNGATLVLTNGCFDLLHAGHVQYLAAARALGDVLLVGLNSDASTRSLKGEGRPLMPLADRALVLLALRSVDAVVPFEEMTAGPLIAAVRPPLYVKGGDWAVAGQHDGTPLPEEPVVRSYGGTIHILTYLPGRSTSALLRRIRAED